MKLTPFNSRALHSSHKRLAVAQFGNALGHAEPEAMRAPSLGRIAVCLVRKPAAPESSQPGIGHPAITIGRPMDRNALGWRDHNRATQPVERQPPCKRLRPAGLAIDQDRVAIIPQQHVEERLALRGEQRRPGGSAGANQMDILRQQPLQEIAGALARYAENGAVGESRAGAGHRA